MAWPPPGTTWADVVAAWARLVAYTNVAWPSWAGRVAAQRSRLGSGGGGGPKPS